MSHDAGLERIGSSAGPIILGQARDARQLGPDAGSKRMGFGRWTH